jgi:hypothetical protein
MSVDNEFAAFKNAADEGDRTDPPDGNHTATLVVAKVGRSKAGDPLVILEWQTEDFAFYWTTFHGVGGQAAAHTDRLLGDLGIDTGEIQSFSELSDELAAVEGHTFIVSVKRNGTWLNLKVLERPTEVQTQIKVPPPPAAKPRNAIFDDDDVPF